MIYVQISEELEIPTDLASDSPLWTSLETVLENAALAACQRAGVLQEVELTIVLSDDRQLHELNSQFLGIDAPTDVLSFPGGETDPDSNELYLGDVIISYSRAAAQAAAGGHSLQAELQLLVVHGVLHLCGYDHADEAEQARMWALQTAVLQELGCEISGPAM
jgi:probable rRNA maturation factor